MKALISVILPVYNAENFLELAVKSILQQTYSNLELIIIEDGSKDNSKNICKNLQSKDDRIVLVENPENLGVVKSLKKGIENAKGEYIARMDADDISHQQRFEKQLEFLLSHPDISVVGSNVELINLAGESIYKSSSTYFEANTLRFSSYFTQGLFHGSVFAKSHIFKEFNYGLDSKAEDFELWLRLVSKGIKIANLKEVLYIHRINIDGVSRLNEQEQKQCHNLASQLYLKKLHAKELDLSLVEIANNRPSEELTFAIFKKGLGLFKDSYLLIKPKETLEVRQYYGRQMIDIHIQAFKKRKNVLIGVQILLSLILMLNSFDRLAYLFQKMRTH